MPVTLILDRDFLADLRYWTETQPRIAIKILSLVEEISRDPLRGTGKPEPLKTSNTWSRRITQEHRLVYRVDKNQVFLLQCRYHY